MNLFDTIAAVSTPYGKGGIAVIRISGSEAIDIAQRVFVPKSGKALSELECNKMTYGEIFMPGQALSIDDGMAAVFRAPHSFTGEDTVEISCHGGILITRKVLSAVLMAGARSAEAGEFTRRAYVQGKFRLSEAEALGNLLEARSEGQLVLARSNMRGRLSLKMDELYNLLLSIMSSLYALIDFPDEDLSEMSREELLRKLEGAADGIKRLADTYGTGRAVNEGIPTVICGRTNAGKSSVYNRILGYDAAIVTDIEGTTRDVLRECAVLGRVTLMLCDTAGIRSTRDKVESIGIERSFKELENASLVLAVFDGSKEAGSEDIELIDRVCASGAASIALINKQDAAKGEQYDELCGNFNKVIHICAADGEGFEELSRAIEELFIDGNIDIENDAVVTGARQYASLMSSYELLTRALEDMKNGMSLDACCVGIECAMSALAEVDGRQIGEEIVSEIFSKFCVGK